MTKRLSQNVMRNILINHHYGYWWYRQNINSSVVAGGNQNPFDYGQLNLSDYSDRFLVNSAVGQVVKEYKYDVKHGLLSFPKHHVTNNGYQKAGLNMMNGHGLTEKQSTEHTGHSIYWSVLGATKEICVEENPDKIDSGNCLCDNIGANHYSRTLEKPVVYNPRSPYDNSSRFAQPQLHVGVMAIP